MNISALIPSIPKSAPTPKPVGLDAKKALYVAGLIGALINRAAATHGFRGAIPAHAAITAPRPTFGADEGQREEYGLYAEATVTEAVITLDHTDAMRVGFMAFNPVCKQANGFDPDWCFDDPEAAITTRCTLIGVTVDVACYDNGDGSATIALTLPH